MESEARVIFEKVHVRLVKTHLMGQDIKDDKERGAKSEQEESEEDIYTT